MGSLSVRNVFVDDSPPKTEPEKLYFFKLDKKWATGLSTTNEILVLTIMCVLKYSGQFGN